MRRVRQLVGVPVLQGQKILALLFSMSAMRKRGSDGHSQELDAMMLELQRLCSNPDAAAKAMDLLKKVVCPVACTRHAVAVRGFWWCV